MKQNENGRSMIEMLGVLAIIAVLTVGGIAGYTKAMAKIKINKSIQQITQTAQHTRIAFGSQRNYTGLGEGDDVPTVMFTADLAPKEMLTVNADGEYVAPYVFKNAFNGFVTMRYADHYVAGDGMAFVVHFDGLPKEACIGIAIADWSGANGNGFIGLTINQDMPDELLESTCQVKTEKGKATFCTKKGAMPAASATIGCLEHNNYIEIKFY